MVKTLYPGFLLSIVNEATLILAIFKRNLKLPGFTIFEHSLEKIELKVKKI